MLRKLIILLLWLFAQSILVLILFNFIPKNYAGLIAGLGFISVGFWIFIQGFKDIRWRQTFHYWVNVVYLVVGALPIFAMSLTGVGKDLMHLAIGKHSVFIIPSRLWHQVGTFLFLALILTLILDILILWLISRKKK